MCLRHRSTLFTFLCLATLSLMLFCLFPAFGAILATAAFNIQQYATFSNATIEFDEVVFLSPAP